MKALSYTKAHALSEFAIQETQVPEPSLKDHDVLVRIAAISVNPVDYKIRQNRSSVTDQPVILGWDASEKSKKWVKTSKTLKSATKFIMPGISLARGRMRSCKRWTLV